MFWVALLLVFAQVAHAFDACAAHIEDTRQNTMVVKAPCVANYFCENCTFAPVKDICASVSELAVRAAFDAPLAAPPVIIVDAPFIASPIPQLCAQTPLVARHTSSEVLPLRSQYRAPQLSGRAPPFSA